MKSKRYFGFILAALLGAAGLFAVTRAGIVPEGDEPDLDIKVWTEKDEGAVYRPGEPIKVYFKASRDCYVTLYNIDTEGKVHILFPYGYKESNFVEGDQVYRLPKLSRHKRLIVTGPAGVEYIQAVASLHPFPVPIWPRYYDLSFKLGIRFRKGPLKAGVDYIDRIYGDPFVGMVRIDRLLVPSDFDYGTVVTNFTSFYVGEQVWYPRYLCYDCHRPVHHRPRLFNPYISICTVYEINVYKDWTYPRRILERYREKRAIDPGDEARWTVRKKDVEETEKRPDRYQSFRGKGGFKNFVGTIEREKSLPERALDSRKEVVREKEIGKEEDIQPSVRDKDSGEKEDKQNSKSEKALKGREEIVREKQGEKIKSQKPEKQKDTRRKEVSESKKKEKSRRSDKDDKNKDEKGDRVIKDRPERKK